MTAGNGSGASADGTDTQAEVIAFLSDSGAYPERPSRVERIDTHSSVVFLAGRRAYKLKRAIRFPYLDYSTLALRRRHCVAEVRLNRRTAPMIYRGVVSVTRGPEAVFTLQGDGDGGDGDGDGDSDEVVEWLVAMNRFDDDLLLDRLAESGPFDEDLMVRLGRDIAAFHEDAERCAGIDGRDEMAWCLEMNAAELDRRTPRVFERARVEAYLEACRVELDRLGPLLRRRGPDGRIRDCHGDLHLRNICLIDDAPVLFDGIEFDPRLRQIDVLYDLAFLIMDLDHRALRDNACQLLNAYLHRSLDFGGLAALPLYLATRSAIRAHTAAAAGEVKDDPGADDQARSYLTLAADSLAPRSALMVAVGGVSGTGKSTLAKAVSPSVGRVPGAVILRSDAIRKQKLGIGDDERLESSAYAPAARREVYAAIFARARQVLASGHSVILDATFLEPEARLQAEAVAKEAGATFFGAWLHAPKAVLEERLAKRRNDPSDADVAVLDAQLASGIGPLSWTEMSSAEEPGKLTDALAQRLGALG